MKLTKRESAFLQRCAPYWHAALSRERQTEEHFWNLHDPECCIVGALWNNDSSYMHLLGYDAKTKRCNQCADLSIEFVGKINIAPDGGGYAARESAMHRLLRDLIAHVEKSHKRFLRGKK